MIYYVEDERNIRELVVYTLTHNGFEALGLASAAELRTAIDECVPELVLLDIMLPGEDGLSILRWLRQDARACAVPVMMLTARGEEFDKVTGLDMGADDYLAKPFGMMELVSRVKALLRRASGDAGEMRVAGIALDARRHAVTCGGREVALTFKEFELLRFLMENPRIVFSREQLLDRVWGYDYEGGSRTVDVHVQTLRQKLGEGGGAIETVRGVGYRLGARA